MKYLEPYLIEFEEYRSMKTEEYTDNYIVKEDKRDPVILITYDDCIFYVNDEI